MVRRRKHEPPRLHRGTRPAAAHWFQASVYRQGADAHHGHEQKYKVWRKAVSTQAKAQYRGNVQEGPITLNIMFWLPRPQSHYGTGKNAGKIKSSAPAYPIKKPDIDKLLRNTIDGLTGIVFIDDAQVVRLSAIKYFVDEETEDPSAIIRISRA